MFELTFDETTHKYFLDGVEIPSVTQVLKHAGIIDERFYKEGGANRGAAVHLATQFLDEGDLDLGSLDIEIVPYVEAYAKFLQESEFTPLKIEAKGFCNIKSEYAGTLDRYGYFKNKPNQTVVIDIKTGTIPKWAGLQLAAYSSIHGHQGDDRYALLLRGTGTYKLTKFDDCKDYDVFQEAVEFFYSSRVIQEWKEKNG